MTTPFQPLPCGTAGAGDGADVEQLLLCDVMPDGSIAGTALAVYEYDADGNPVGPPTFIDPATGAPYVAQGMLMPCPGDVGCSAPIQFCFSTTTTGPVDHPGRLYDVTLPINPGFAVDSLQIDATTYPANLTWAVTDADGSQFATALQAFLAARFPGQTVTVNNPNAGTAVCGLAEPMTVHIECARIDEPAPDLVELIYNGGRDLVVNPAYLTTPPTNLNGPQFVYVQRQDAGGTLNCTAVANQGWETNDGAPGGADFELWGQGPTGLQTIQDTTPTPRGTPVQEITADFPAGPNPPTIWQTFTVPAGGTLRAVLVHGARDAGEQHRITLSTGDTGDNQVGDIINNLTVPPQVTNAGGGSPGPWTTFSQDVALGAGVYTFAISTTNPVGANRGGLFTDMRVYVDAPDQHAAAAVDDDTCVVTVEETTTTTICEYWQPRCINGEITAWVNVADGEELGNAAFWGQAPAPQCCLPAPGGGAGGTVTAGNLVHFYPVCGVVGGVSQTLVRVVYTDQSGGVLQQQFIGANGGPVTPATWAPGECPDAGVCRDTSPTLLCDVTVSESETIFDPQNIAGADGWELVAHVPTAPGGFPPDTPPISPAATGPNQFGQPSLGARADMLASVTGVPWPGYDAAVGRWILRKTFVAAEDGTAHVTATLWRADGGGRVRINGIDLGIYSQWGQPGTSGTFTAPVTAGVNTIEMEVRDDWGFNWVTGRLDVATTRAERFLRRNVYDCTSGAVVDTIDTTLDGTPYTVLGDVIACELVDDGDDCCDELVPGQTVAPLELCDVVDGVPIRFLRAYVYPDGSASPIVSDTELDGVTPYVVAGTVGACCTDVVDTRCVRLVTEDQAVSTADPGWVVYDDPTTPTATPVEPAGGGIAAVPAGTDILGAEHYVGFLLDPPNIGSGTAYIHVVFLAAAGADLLGVYFAGELVGTSTGWYRLPYSGQQHVVIHYRTTQVTAVPPSPQIAMAMRLSDTLNNGSGQDGEFTKITYCDGRVEYRDDAGAVVVPPPAGAEVRCFSEYEPVGGAGDGCCETCGQVEALDLCYTFEGSEIALYDETLPGAQGWIVSMWPGGNGAPFPPDNGLGGAAVGVTIVPGLFRLAGRADTAAGQTEVPTQSAYQKTFVSGGGVAQLQLGLFQADDATNSIVVNGVPYAPVPGTLEIPVLPGVNTVEIVVDNLVPTNTSVGGMLTVILPAGVIPFRRVVRYGCDGEVLGSQDYSADGTTPFVPPGPVGTCAQTAELRRDVEQEVLCDDDGPFLRVYSYGEDSGAPAGPPADFTLDGAEYVPLGDVVRCSQTVNVQDIRDSEHVVLCDADDTPFLRTFTRDGLGVVVATVDTTLAGGAFVPVEPVGRCADCCPVVVGEGCWADGPTSGRHTAVRLADGTIQLLDQADGHLVEAADVVACAGELVASHVFDATAGVPWTPAAIPAGTLVGLSFSVIAGTADVVDADGTPVADLPAGYAASWEAPAGGQLTPPLSITPDAASRVVVVMAVRP